MFPAFPANCAVVPFPRIGNDWGEGEAVIERGNRLAAAGRNGFKHPHERLDIFPSLQFIHRAAAFLPPSRPTP